MTWQTLKCVKKLPNSLKLNDMNIGDEQDWPLWADDEHWNDINEICGLKRRESQPGWTAKKLIQALYNDGYLIKIAEIERESII